MANVTVLSGAPTGSSFVYDGTTFYQWAFVVNIDGQIYVVDEWFDTNDPDLEPSLEQDVIDDIENNDVEPGGIADGDGNRDDDEGDDDGALASGDGSGDGSDFGDSA
jgi:hypothetical protein